jgi:hypothetical protein
MSLDPDDDPFRPPRRNTEVGCLHCGEVYDSYRVEWREEAGRDGKPEGFWCCSTPGCGGVGFGFDILPTDPDWEDEEGRGMGWVGDDDDEEDDGLPDDPLTGGSPPKHDSDEDIPW